jgi:hypothetical protein
MALQMPTSTMEQQCAWGCQGRPAQRRCWSSICCVPCMLAGMQVCLAAVSSTVIPVVILLHGSPTCSPDMKTAY